MVVNEERDSVKLAFSSGYFMCGSDVFSLPLPGPEKLVYMALTRYAGSNNRAWPKYDTLARDASCSKRRAIDAVNRLCSCRLVAKEGRGNRSNVFMVFPPKYYCENYDKNTSSNIKKGADSAPQNNGLKKLYQSEGELSAPSEKTRVQNLHAQGAAGAPSGCSDNTLRVQQVHPNINNNNNKKINTTKEDVSEYNSSTLNAKDVEEVKKAFKEKRSIVRDDVIEELLKAYPPKDIRAAIKSVNFEQARNPIAVIRWMLKEGSYVMPLDMEELRDMPADEKPPLVDDEEVRKMISETKEVLSGNFRAGAI